MFENDYFIDVGRDNNGFKLILKDTSGKIVKVFDDSDSIINQAWREVSQLVENYDIMIYGRIKTYRDGDFIFDLFKKYLFIILVEQDASYLASLDGYRIKYPDFTYYVATLYKIYKAYVNPRSTLGPQEFILMISPLLTKVRPDISGSELVNLFDTFAVNYYRAIDYMNRERIGINFMPAVERPMTAQPNTVAIQPNEVAIRPSTTVNQPNSVAASSQPISPPQNPRLQPVNNPPQAVPQRPPKIAQPKEEMAKPVEEANSAIRNITTEHKRPKYSENG
jgi:hypothetical protein